MAKGEETTPLTGDSQGDACKEQRIALGITAVLNLLTAIACLPMLLPLWHDKYFRYSDAEARAWAWFGINSLWFALALTWTLLRKENSPATAVACCLCALFYAYLDIVVIAQWIRGFIAVTGVGDFIVHTALMFLCGHAAWKGVVSRGQTSSSGNSSARRRAFRKWALVASSAQLLVAFLACWPLEFGAFSPPKEGREAAPWEWNSAVLFVEALAVLWGAFLMHGGFVDETKQAMCVWCAMIFAGAFALSSFSWPTLGMVGHNMITSIILAIDVVVLTAFSGKEPHAKVERPGDVECAKTTCVLLFSCS